MGKKAGGAPMIKISWVAVFDPQYAVIVSPQLHKKPNTGVAREKRIYKLSHSCQEVAGFAHWLFLWFLEDKEASVWPNSRELGTFPPSCHTSHFDDSLVSHVFQKESKKKRKYINSGHSEGQTRKAVAFLNSPVLGLFKVLLSRGRGKWRHRFGRNV